MYRVSGCSDRKVQNCSFYEVCESYEGAIVRHAGAGETENKGSCLFTHGQCAGAITQVAQI